MAHIYRTCILAHHLSLRSSMVRASHRSSEGCGFDHRLELRNHFLSIKLEDRSSIILRFSFSYNVFRRSMHIKKASYLKINKTLTIKAYKPRNSFSNILFCRILQRSLKNLRKKYLKVQEQVNICYITTYICGVYFLAM